MTQTPGSRFRFHALAVAWSAQYRQVSNRDLLRLAVLAFEAIPYEGAHYGDAVRDFLHLVLDDPQSAGRALQRFVEEVTPGAVAQQVAFDWQDRADVR
jgi:hypothetical protein